MEQNRKLAFPPHFGTLFGTLPDDAVKLEETFLQVDGLYSGEADVGASKHPEYSNVISEAVALCPPADSYEFMPQLDRFLEDEDSHLWKIDGRPDEDTEFEVCRAFSAKADNVPERASFADLITDAVSLGRSKSAKDTAELHEGDEIELVVMTEEEEAMENKLFDALQSAVDLAGTYRRVKPTKVGGARRAYALQRFREKRRRRSGKPYKPRYTLRQKLSASRPRANGKFQAMVSYVNPWFS